MGDEASGMDDSRPCTVCKTSIPGSNPGGASKIY